jgi:hypothetical protein
VIATLFFTARIIKMIPATGRRKNIGVSSNAVVSKLNENRRIRLCAKPIMLSPLNIHEETAITIAEPLIQ